MKQMKFKDGINVVIRQAVSEDAARLAEIKSSIVQENRYMVTGPAEFKLTTDEEKHRIRNVLDHSGKALFVAEVEEKVVGFVNFANGSKKRKKHVGGLSILIEKGSRESGIGRELMKTVLKWAENNSLIEKVALAVFSNNPRAIQLYEKLGFIEEGRRVKELKFDHNKYVDEVLMYKFV